MTRSSSWIQSILYRNGFLAIFLSEDLAMLYSEIPGHIPGLLICGTGKRSVGRAYSKLVKDRYPYNRIEGREKVEELRRLMNGEMREVA